MFKAIILATMFLYYIVFIILSVIGFRKADKYVITAHFGRRKRFLERLFDGYSIIF